MTTLLSYTTAADSTEEAIEIADNWLSMFLDWQNPESQEDYEIDAAVAFPAGADAEGNNLHTVVIPVSVTETTDETILALI